MAPIIAAWLHFPDRRGLVSGIIIAGFGLGVFIYNFVSNQLANPDNLSPSLFTITEHDPLCKKIIYYYFSSIVAD